MKPSLLCLLIASPLLWSATTEVRFVPTSPEVGPFPSDAVTIADANQKTGRRVNLPMPAGCDSQPELSACTDALLLNQLDGFSVNPRMTVCFSDDIDTSTLRAGIRIYPIDRFGPSIGINQVIYDRTSHCAFAKPNQVLDQDTRYVLTVTDAIRDSSGKSVKPSKEFKEYLQQACGNSCAILARLLAGQTEQLVAASPFTTLSASDWLEKARAFINAPQTPVAVLPAAAPASAFNVADLTSLTWVPDNAVMPPTALPVQLLDGVKQIAFGLYLSPNFLNVSGPFAGSISPTPTGPGAVVSPVPVPGLAGVPPGFVPVSFHVFLPEAASMPAGGFPVVIYGHGLGDSQFGAPTYIASTLAKNGFATLAIEIMGHGFGAGGVVQAVTAAGTTTVATPGRGIQLPQSPAIGPSDGCILPGVYATRDCSRQTAVDLLALVRTMRATGGLGLQLNPERIYYVGQSFGSIYGTLLHAVEPSIRAAVLNVAGGTAVDISRLAPVGRPLANYYLQTRTPSLLNVPPAPSPAYFHDQFNDNYVFRDLPAVTNNVPAALDLQAAFEFADWFGMPGDALAYAPLLKTRAIGRPTLFQFALGDLEVPNPTNSAVIRAAGAQASSRLFRFDRAVQKAPELLGVTMPGFGFPALPHRFLSNPTIIDPTQAAEASISLAAQQQVTGFLASNGASIPDANQFLTGSVFDGMNLFEVPVVLPEGLNFLQIQP